MSGILLEPFRPERLLSRLDALSIELQGLFSRLGLLFGEQNIGIGASGEIASALCARARRVLGLV